MFRTLVAGTTLLSAIIVSGCAAVPMASREEDAAAKQFPVPKDGKAAVYIYRNSMLAPSFKWKISLDGAVLGETANKVYFYKVIEPGKHVVSAKSVLSEGTLPFDAAPSRNYYIEQYITIGGFTGGTNLKMVNEEEGMRAVLECGMAR